MPEIISSPIQRGLVTGALGFLIATGGIAAGLDRLFSNPTAAEREYAVFKSCYEGLGTAVLQGGDQQFKLPDNCIDAEGNFIFAELMRTAEAAEGVTARDLVCTAKNYTDPKSKVESPLVSCSTTGARVPTHQLAWYEDELDSKKSGKFANTARTLKRLLWSAIPGVVIGFVVGGVFYSAGDEVEKRALAKERRQKAKKDGFDPSGGVKPFKF